ncbi:LysR substrate-binding domain-containing protein [Lacisediminimonas profundi]|uniref:LysR substrate-binding domain-containing protein n=1 Tax=Lacisediminimonas profundi TaxID=2603856 RepID=UPI00124B74D2|nr:LysR substrate-binding domain-containing protein [Lacisediminimonas profundi]
MSYDLTDLKLFLAIAEAGNLSNGASSVHITASSGSYRLKNLEHALGTALFVRTPRGMDVTPAGKILVAHVRQLLAGLERMHGEVGRFSAGLKGQIRLLANSSSLNGFVVPSLSRFLVAHPNVNIDLEERTSQSIPGAIAAHEANIGIMAGDIDIPGLKSWRYAVDKLVLAVPIGHPLARKAEIRFGEALDFDFVCTGRSSSNFLFLRDTAQDTGKQLNVRLHANSFDTVLTLVEQGVGVALIPFSVVASALDTARVAALDLREPWALRKLSMVVRAEEELPSFAAAFAEFLLADPRVAATREGQSG